MKNFFVCFQLFVRGDGGKMERGGGGWWCNWWQTYRLTEGQQRLQLELLGWRLLLVLFLQLRLGQLGLGLAGLLLLQRRLLERLLAIEQLQLLEYVLRMRMAVRLGGILGRIHDHKLREGRIGGRINVRKVAEIGELLLRIRVLLHEALAGSTMSVVRIPIDVIAVVLRMIGHLLLGIKGAATQHTKVAAAQNGGVKATLLLQHWCLLLSRPQQRQLQRHSVASGSAHRSNGSGEVGARVTQWRCLVVEGRVEVLRRLAMRVGSVGAGNQLSVRIGNGSELLLWQCCLKVATLSGRGNNTMLLLLLLLLQLMLRLLLLVVLLLLLMQLRCGWHVEVLLLVRAQHSDGREVIWLHQHVAVLLRKVSCNEEERGRG